jgi:O-antigen/teichoic acid export membrane protein
MIFSKNNSALNRIIVAFFSQGATILITLLSLPFLISNLGIKNYAIFGLFLTFQSLSSIIEGGASINLIKEVAQNRNETSIINSTLLYRKIFYNALLISFITSFVVLNNWNYSHLENIEFSIIIAFSLSIRLLTSFFKSISIGFNRHNNINIFSIFFYLFRLVIPIVFGFSINGFLYLQLVLIILELVYFKRTSSIKLGLNFLYSLKSKIEKDEKYKEENKYAKQLIILTVLSVILTNIDKTLLSIFGSQEDFGSFQAITNLSGGLLMLLGPLNSVFQPLLISVKKDKIQFKNLFSFYWLILIFCFGFITVFLQFFSEEILSFWLGNEFNTKMLNLFNYHLVFSFGVSLMSFAYLYSLVMSCFEKYIKIVISITVITTILYAGFFIFNYIESAFYYCSIISLIFSFFILIFYGNEIFISELKKVVLVILILTFIIVLISSSLVFFELKSSLKFYQFFIYVGFLIYFINRFKYLLKSLKSTS